MGNDIRSHSNLDIKTEKHTDDEELPLNKQRIITSPPPLSPQSQISTTSCAASNVLPSGWEQRIDRETNKPYYVDHNTHSTQWNPPNTITKIKDGWTTKNTSHDTANIIIHKDSNKINQFSDCWDIEDPKQNEFISFHPILPNTISLKSRDKKNKQFISCFGTKIVTKGEYKRWQIKILPNSNIAGHAKKAQTAKVMIGVVDIDSINGRERGQPIDYEFWLLPYFGYAFGGEKGRKYHIDKKGRGYSKKYKIGDIITVELNRTNNRFIMHNDLKFFTNERVDGMAFNVENDRNYVLAVALCDDKCAVQILD